MTAFHVGMTMDNARESLLRGTITMEEYMAVLHDVTVRLATRTAAASNTLRLTAEAVLARGDTVTLP
jgi:hypothetical protein